MSEDRVRSFMTPGRLRRRLRALIATRRGLRRLTVTGLPAAMAVAGAFPVIVNTADPSYTAPSKILCATWSHCDTHGFDSYRYGAHWLTPYWRAAPGDECTNYTAFVESTVYHVAAPSFLLGNGGQWAAAARAHGVLVNHTPSVGAVAEWDASAPGMAPMGHVGVVEAVGQKDRYIIVSQQHMGGAADYNWTMIKANFPANEWQEWPGNFIHFTIPRRADLGFFAPGSQTASLRDSQSAGPVNTLTHLGYKGVIPLVGDWSGSGIDKLGFYDPRYGVFHLLGVNRTSHPNVAFKFGPPGMIPLTGDWKGIGRDGVGYYNPKTGTFYLRESLTAGRPGETFKFGPAGMIPIAGDWTGGRRDGIGFYNPNTGVFELRNALSAGPASRSFRFGPAHMKPIAGAWAGGRQDFVGYYNQWTGTFYLRSRLSNGPATSVVRLGPQRMIPLTGEWFGR